ncbi:MAG: hypothetical protein HC821_00155 [Lewinella sp.]|nr:hypothetical protein [Lewinella sp.]
MQRLILVLTVFGLYCGSFARLAAQPGGLPSGEVDVVRSFEARLADAERVLVAPVLPLADTSIRRQQYSVSARPLPLEYPAPSSAPKASAARPPPKATTASSR